MPRTKPAPVIALSSSRRIVTFAGLFLRGRAGGFKKDIDICLTGNGRRQHAYFPGLITCISFLDLLSGLYAGRLDGHGRPEFIAYCGRFFPPDQFDELSFKLVYEAFRHKVAHLSHPYPIFDTRSKPNVFSANNRMRVTWTVYAQRRASAVELIRYPELLEWKKRARPWPIFYDHRMLISVQSLAILARGSIGGPNGYLASLEADPQLRANFVNCMQAFFQKF